MRIPNWSIVACVALVCGFATTAAAAFAESPFERPVLQIQGDLPVAYLLSRGGLEASLGYHVANQTIDPVGTTGVSLFGGLAPGLANTGFPRGVAGRSFRMSVGTAARFNAYADVGHDDYNFSMAGLTLDHQVYGLRWNLCGEKDNRPAVTLDYSYHVLDQPNPLETDGHRFAIVASQSVARHFMVHGTLGFHKDDVTAELPNGPAPQTGLPIPFFSYPQVTLETGLGVTWTGGSRTDITLAVEHKNFNREIDDFVPGGGVGYNDRLLLHVSHAASHSLVITSRIERHSHGLSALAPQLYNPRSVDAFSEPFGYFGLGVTWRGDLSRR